MVSTFNLYIDDSGTRHPDRKIGRTPAHKHDWFALGGVLLRSEDENEARELHGAFCGRWNIAAPLHSSDIRSRAGNFHWIEGLEESERLRFYEELYLYMAASPVIGIACVIDRTGYNARYATKYGTERWQLCKTAFSVVVERSAKFAIKNDRKMRVFVERGDKLSDRTIKDYYNQLRVEGMPFASNSSAKYAPLSRNQLEDTLYEFRTKKKSSPPMQLADLYLWPICMGGYDLNNKPYKRLLENAKLIDCHLDPEDIPALGIKYSCFELEQAKAQIHKNPE